MTRTYLLHLEKPYSGTTVTLEREASSLREAPRLATEIAAEQAESTIVRGVEEAPATITRRAH